MDKLDLAGQPPWLVAVSILAIGVIVPIALALIGKQKGQQKEYVPPQPIEVATPWLVQNLLEIKMTVESIKRTVDEIVTRVKQTNS